MFEIDWFFLFLLFVCSQNKYPDRDGAGTGEDRSEIIRHGSAGKVGDGIFFRNADHQVHEAIQASLRQPKINSWQVGLVIGLLYSTKVRVTSHKSLLKLPAAASQLADIIVLS